MISATKKSFLGGFGLVLVALGCTALRNHPALGISPLAIGLIEGVVYCCIMLAVRMKSMSCACAIALIIPVFLWLMGFLDAFMIPVSILTGLVMMGAMHLAPFPRWPWLGGLLFVAALPFITALAGNTVALWIVKREVSGRAFLVAWNSSVYSLLSILGAALLCVPWKKKN